MGIEIERKFLVVGDRWRERVESSIDISQGYVAIADRATVRIRLAGDRAWITLKGEREGARRSEFEYEIPPAEAREMLVLYATSIVSKTRHHLASESLQWTVDVFHDLNEGLVLLEIEGSDEHSDLPDWVGEDVTENNAFLNASLSRRPISQWSMDDRVMLGL